MRAEWRRSADKGAGTRTHRLGRQHMLKSDDQSNEALLGGEIVMTDSETKRPVEMVMTDSDEEVQILQT